MTKNNKNTSRVLSYDKRKADGSYTPVYQPYIGPSGPTDQQVHNNNLVLQQELKKIGIKSQITTADKVPGIKDLGLKDVEIVSIKYKDNAYLTIGYDRWGYIIDGVDEDQIDLTTTIKVIKYISTWWS